MYVLNSQRPQPVDRRSDGEIRVHSIFRTIQGEGPFAGYAALFIRLSGCNLQCPGCDTEYTSKNHPATPERLLQMVQGIYDWPPGQLIVITGGEPFRQNITPTVAMLLEHSYLVQIESNGVLYPGDDFPWQDVTVVVSPKTGKIHPKTARRASAYKYVVKWGNVDVDGLPKTALGHPLGGASHVARPPEGWNGPIYLQPMDEKDDRDNMCNMKAVVESVLKHPGFIMGVQMHKLTGLP